MLIEQRPFKTKIKHHICGYHQENPGKSFAGCTCGSSISQIPLTDEEIKAEMDKVADEPIFGENIKEALPILKELAVRFKDAWKVLGG